MTTKQRENPRTSMEELLEKYMKPRTSGDGVNFEGFNNDVVFNRENNGFDIYVTPFNEDRILFAANNIDGKPARTDPPATYENLDRLFKQFTVDFNPQEAFFEKNAPYLLNGFSGAKVSVPLGEGILNFCYTDFEKNMELLTPVFYTNKKTETKKDLVLTKDEEEFAAYRNMMECAADFFYTSLYTAIFPPVFLMLTKKAKNKYFDYLKTLQEEFLLMIEFCYDENHFPEALGILYPSERYERYCVYHGRPYTTKRTELFTCDARRFTGIEMPFGMPFEEMAKRVKMILEDNKHLQPFADKYADGNLEAVLAITAPKFINVQYACKSIFEMLNLEFTKMLENNISFKKCGRCGKYFIMKGNYNTEFCDRVQDGETNTCQNLAAQENYKNKIKDNAAWNAYNKYYKRYFARTKVGTIKPPVFKKWNYEAIYKRDDCSDGKLPLDEFVSWMEEAFPNRKRKR